MVEAVALNARKPHASMSPLRIAVLISGRGSNLGALAHALADKGELARIGVVLSDQPAAQGLEIARSYGIPIVIEERRPKERSNAEFNSALVEALKPYQPELIVLAGFMRILTTEFISKYAGRIINIHPSLLPAFPGLDVQKRALEAGVPESGCTVHFVEEEVDAGPIIKQAKVPVVKGDTVGTLSARILEQEHKILPEVVLKIANGEIKIG